MSNAIELKAGPMAAVFSGVDGRPVSMGPAGNPAAYSFKRFEWSICLDGEWLSSGDRCQTTVEAEGQVALTVRHKFERFSVFLFYRAFPSGHIQSIMEARVHQREPFAVEEANMLFFQLEAAAGEAFDYVCSEQHHLATIFRRGGLSLIAGNEYPYAKHDWTADSLRLSFRPCFRVAAGESFKCEPTFLTVARCTGYASGLCLAGESAGRLADPATLPNPKDRILDLGETDALGAVVRDALPRRKPQPMATAEAWWINFQHREKMSPFISWCRDQKDEDAIVGKHRFMFDEMKAVGVDRFVLDRVFDCLPEWPPKEWMYLDLLPSEKRPWWRVTKLGEKIAQIARDAGFKIGMYLGFGDYYPDALLTNTPTNMFLANKKPEWTISDEAGKPRSIVSGRYDNIAFISTCCCLGVDGFADWLAKVQIETIRRNGLSWWNFDFNSWQFENPACVCHAEGHRHFPGESVYAQWRGAMRTIRKIAEAAPDGLWLQCYWGLKPAAPFSYKYFDANEMYYEYASHPDGRFIDPEQRWPNANDLRFQAWASANDRFFPSYLNYEPVEDSEFDILTAVGMGGSFSFYDNIADERKAFCRRWLEWSRQNAELRDAPARWLFGPPRRGGIDGVARFLDSRGVIFIYNPNRFAVGAEIPLIEELGVTADGPFWIKRLHPDDCGYMRGGSASFKKGEILRLDVSPESVLVLEIADRTEIERYIEMECQAPAQKALLTALEFEEMRRRLGHIMPADRPKTNEDRPAPPMLG